MSDVKKAEHTPVVAQVFEDMRKLDDLCYRLADLSDAFARTGNGRVATEPRGGGEVSTRRLPDPGELLDRARTMAPAARAALDAETPPPAERAPGLAEKADPRTLAERLRLDLAEKEARLRVLEAGEGYRARVRRAEAALESADEANAAAVRATGRARAEAGRRLGLTRGAKMEPSRKLVEAFERALGVRRDEGSHLSRSRYGKNLFDAAMGNYVDRVVEACGSVAAAEEEHSCTYKAHTEAARAHRDLVREVWNLKSEVSMIKSRIAEVERKRGDAVARRERLKSDEDAARYAEARRRLALIERGELAIDLSGPRAKKGKKR